MLKKVMYVNWFSIEMYLSWLGCIAIAHSQGLLEAGASWFAGRKFWQVTCES